jgi:hypothetical protein
MISGPRKEMRRRRSALPFVAEIMGPPDKPGHDVI